MGPIDPNNRKGLMSGNDGQERRTGERRRREESRGEEKRDEERSVKAGGVVVVLVACWLPVSL